MHGQQYKCPHGVTIGSFAVSKQMLHSNGELSQEVAYGFGLGADLVSSCAAWLV